MNVTDKVLEIGLPIVLTALVTGISALMKLSYERRDRRRTAERQLELAKIRTGFVKDWLEVNRSIGTDPDYLEAATRKALDELEAAYSDAQLVIEESLASPTAEAAGQQARRFLLLVPRKRVSSYVIVALLYLFVGAGWYETLTLDRSAPGAVPLGEDIVYMLIGSAFFWVVAFASVTWLERRADRSTNSAADDPPSPAEPVPSELSPPVRDTAAA